MQLPDGAWTKFVKKLYEEPQYVPFNQPSVNKK